MRLGGNMQLDKLARSMDPEKSAIQINDHIFMGKGVSNSHLVTTSDGDVLINAGEPFEDHTARYSKVSRGPIRKIIFTQSHHDHIGSWARFTGPNVETIAQENFPFVRGERNRLARHFLPRRQRIFGERPDWGREVRLRTNEVIAEPVLTTTFKDFYAFDVGGRRFELISAQGGETLDSLFVWLPDEKTVFSGNFLGPIFGTMPNLYTIRGDRLRSAVRYLEGLEHLIALEPRMLITGHGDPIVGGERVHDELAKLRDAVRYVYDETVKGMNEGTDVFTLMRTVTLPAHLQIGQAHGKVSWCVRAIWEEATGWFRFESTTELYEVPARAIWAELAEVAGGPDVLAGRAADHVAAGRPLEALHLIDIALSVDPAHRRTRQTQIEALQILLDRSGRENYSEVHWLESEIDAARAALRRGG